MSSQSWLDIRIKRINYFLRVVLVSTIYYKLKQFITSTHTNYFDQVFKERGAKPLVELDNYTALIQLVNFMSTIFLQLLDSLVARIPWTARAAHYTATPSSVKRLFFGSGYLLLF
jgi:hypothetical protein